MKGERTMTTTEKRMYLLLIFCDAAAIFISMIAGPLGNETVAISTAVCAIIISLALILYGLYFWHRKER